MADQHKILAVLDLSENFIQRQENVELKVNREDYYYMTKKKEVERAEGGQREIDIESTKDKNCYPVLRQLSRPKSERLNLSEGWHPLPNVWKGENIDILLQSLLHHDLVGKATFVCKKKVLLVIATCSPEACRGIGVVRLQNSYYLYLYPTEKFPADGYHGLRFEQLLTTTKTGASREIDQNKEFGALCKVNLGGHDLIVSGELDCLDGEDRVELKTYKKGFETAYPDQLLKWWLQCCFLNIGTIYLGITKTYGADGAKYVDVIERQSLTDLKRLVDGKTNERAQCLARIKVFLKFLQDHATEEGQVYLVKPQSGTKNYTIERNDDAGKDFISARLRNELIKRST
ncbi:uncharacterized protein [Watersipora subatra]|uniref:uncharacterized protein isoform X2 n=1 Tax=Watersipora subatra TaxID=2589382 RepID=UPI00355C94EE